MRLIVGLGNPGRDYKDTRHNTGFLFIDYIVRNSNIKIIKNEVFNCECYISKEEDFILLKPQEFINYSGKTIKGLIEYYNIFSEDILVVYDDLKLEIGGFRLREKGSSGGHNGMLNIINEIGNLQRLRIGIGNNSEVVNRDWVLQKFSDKEVNELLKTFDVLMVPILLWVKKEKSFIQLMNQLNFIGKKKKKKEIFSR